jgi:hypothetical protein
MGFMVDKVALGKVFSKYFSFLCQFSFLQLLNTHLSSGAGRGGQIVANIPSELSLTPPQEIKSRSQRSMSANVLRFGDGVGMGTFPGRGA